MDPVVTIDKSSLEALEQGVQVEQVSDSGDSAYTEVEGTVIFTEAGTADKDIEAAVSGWNLLPECVQNKLVEYDMDVFLSESACSALGSQYGGYSYGLQYKANAATLEITSVTQNAYCIIGTKGDIEGTVLHEVAHLLDFGIAVMEEGVYSASNCRISDSAEWQQICAEDGADLAAIDTQTAANSYSAKELFAEAFRLAFQDPQKLIDASPDAYTFVQSMVQKYAEG